MRVSAVPHVVRQIVSLLGCGACLLASACQSVDETVRTEVVPLAEGEYHGARWGGTQVERFYTVAWKGSPQAPDASAVIVSAEHKKPCSLGTTVSRYTSLRPQTASKYVIGSPSPARITLLEELDEAGFGTLRFSDIDCQRIDLSVPDVDKRNISYVYEPDQTHQKIAVRNRAGSLIFVDPWAQEQHEVAQNVAAFSPFETGEWLIEGGQLVKRDLEGKELVRRGSQVAGFLLLSAKGDLAYQEARGIYTIRAGKATRIVDKGCLYLGNLEPFIAGAIGYFEEPCSANKLRVAVGEDKTYTYDDTLTGLSISPGMLLYTTRDGDTTKLWLVDGANPMKPQAIGEYARFVLEGAMSLPSNLTVVLSAEEDKTHTVWQLKRSGGSAELIQLTSGLVSWARSDRGLALLYANHDLILADGSIDSVVLRVPNADNSQFRFIMGGKALGLAYLDNVDPDTLLGSLELHLLSGAHYTLAQNVREFEYVWWPERGLEFVAGGPDAGIRFARIDIPCEATSDAPWACGF